jgi:hypothetical protein
MREAAPMHMTVCTMVAAVFFSAISASAQPATGGMCPLSTFTNGQTVTIHGRVGQPPHDVALVVPGCAEAVVLVYAGDPESRESSEKLLKDESFKRFVKYTNATYGKIGSKGICMQCPKYQVDATLTGRLDVASDTVPDGQWKDKLGMLHDRSGKFVGKAGSGHPPIQKYRLIIESVSDVVARELPKPKLPDSEGPRSLLHESGQAQGLEAQP